MVPGNNQNRPGDHLSPGTEQKDSVAMPQHSPSFAEGHLGMPKWLVVQLGKHGSERKGKPYTRCVKGLLVLYVSLAISNRC
jgi:hypothetical protein